MAVVLAKFEAFLDATPELAIAWAEDRGDTLIRAMKVRFATTKRGRQIQPLRTFKRWCVAQADSAKLIPEDHAVFRWADTEGLPEYFLFLGWEWFKENYTKGSGRNKKYRDWPAVFYDSVTRRYAKLWFFDIGTNTFKLTTEGQLLARRFPDEDRNA